MDGDEITGVGKASGTSLKISYIKQIRLGDGTYILGSGIYLAEDSQYATDIRTESKVLGVIIIVCLILLVLFWAI